MTVLQLSLETLLTFSSLFCRLSLAIYPEESGLQDVEVYVQIQTLNEVRLCVRKKHFTLTTSPDQLQSFEPGQATEGY